MNALPITGEPFATNQISPDTERCYCYQLRNFAQWMETEPGKIELKDVTAAVCSNKRLEQAILADPLGAGI